MSPGCSRQQAASCLAREGRGRRRVRRRADDGVPDLRRQRDEARSSVPSFATPGGSPRGSWLQCEPRNPQGNDLKTNFPNPRARAHPPPSIATAHLGVHPAGCLRRSLCGARRRRSSGGGRSLQKKWPGADPPKTPKGGTGGVATRRNSLARSRGSSARPQTIELVISEKETTEFRQTLGCQM